MKTVFKLWLAALVSLVTFATSTAQDLSMIQSPAALRAYALERTVGFNLWLQSDAIVSSEGQAQSFAYTNGGFPPGISVDEMSGQVRSAEMDFKVDEEMAPGSELWVSLSFHDEDWNSTFYGYTQSTFVVEDGVVRPDDSAYHVGIQLSYEVAIPWDGAQDAEIALSGGGRVWLWVSNGYIYFPSQYAGEEGRLIVHDGDQIAVVDIPTGEFKAKQNINYQLEWTWVQGVYSVEPYEGESLEVFPWYSYAEEVYEVSNAASLKVTPYEDWRPYVVVVKEIGSNTTEYYPSNSSGEYNLDPSKKYRLWFDWDLGNPTVELNDVDDVEIGDTGSIHRLIYEFKVTGSPYGDVFIPTGSAPFQTYLQAGSGTLDVTETVSSTGETVTLDGQEYIHIRAGESSTVVVALHASVTGNAIYEFQIGYLEFRFQDGNWDSVETRGTKRAIYFGPPGKG